MNVDNLSQFNSKEFFRLLGFYIQQSRANLKLSIEQVSLKTQIPTLAIEQIELGIYSLADSELRSFIHALHLDEKEILNLAKITQVQNINDVSREINANFPR